MIMVKFNATGEVEQQNKSEALNNKLYKHSLSISEMKELLVVMAIVKTGDRYVY